MAILGAMTGAAVVTTVGADAEATATGVMVGSVDVISGLMICVVVLGITA